jgi:hypothetical protein
MSNKNGKSRQDVKGNIKQWWRHIWWYTPVIPPEAEAERS